MLFLTRACTNSANPQVQTSQTCLCEATLDAAGILAHVYANGHFHTGAAEAASQSDKTHETAAERSSGQGGRATVGSLQGIRV